MDQILDTPVEDKRKLVYAGFWIRTGAFVIDSILLLLAQIVVLFGINLFSNSVFSGSSLRGVLLFYIAALSISFFYFVLLESSDKQATLGKMAVGIKVGDERGNRISFGRATGRFFSKFLSSIALCIGFMMAGWDRQKQAMHDNIADTYVFYSK